MSGALSVLIRSLPLGSRAEVRVSLEAYAGRNRVDLRTWADYMAGPVEMRGPTKKGVSLPVSDLPALSAAVREAEAKARALGLLDEGGALAS